MLVLPSLPTQECGSGVPWGPVQPISHDTWLPFTPTHTPGSSLAPEKIPTAQAGPMLRWPSLLQPPPCSLFHSLVLTQVNTP